MAASLHWSGLKEGELPLSLRSRPVIGSLEPAVGIRRSPRLRILAVVGFAGLFASAIGAAALLSQFDGDGPSPEADAPAEVAVLSPPAEAAPHPKNAETPALSAALTDLPLLSAPPIHAREMSIVPPGTLASDATALAEGALVAPPPAVAADLAEPETGAVVPAPEMSAVPSDAASPAGEALRTRDPVAPPTVAAVAPAAPEVRAVVPDAASPAGEALRIRDPVAPPVAPVAPAAPEVRAVALPPESPAIDRPRPSGPDTASRPDPTAGRAEPSASRRVRRPAAARRSTEETGSTAPPPRASRRPRPGAQSPPDAEPRSFVLPPALRPSGL